MDRIDAVNLFVKNRNYRRLLAIGPIATDRWNRVEAATKFTTTSQGVNELLSIHETGSFDLVIVSGSNDHEIRSIVEIALGRLAPGGAVMIFDCLSNAAARAFTVFRQRPDLDAFVGDFDGGVGLIRKITNPLPMAIAKPMDQITDTDLDAHRQDWLRLQAPFVFDMIAERLWAPPTIAVLVIGKSDEEVESFKAGSPHAEQEARLVYVSNPGRRYGATAAIANPFIDSSTEDVLSVVHADTSFAPGSITAFAASAVDNNCVTGIVGRIDPSRAFEGNMGYIWCGGPGGIVSTLDSCSVFFRRTWDLRFDGATFDDFHCVVEDICLQARKKGIPALVPQIKASHVGTATEATWNDNFWKYRQKLLDKYPGEEIHTV